MKCPHCKQKPAEVRVVGRRVGREVESRANPQPERMHAKCNHPDEATVTYHECSNGHQWSHAQHHDCWCGHHSTRAKS